MSTAIASLAAMATCAACAHASLVGDQIFVDRLIPDAADGPFSFCQEQFGTGPQGCAVTVTDGVDDRLALTGGNNLYVNVEASEIRIEFGPEFGGGGPFLEHLLVFNDLDFLDPNAKISGFTLDTNFAGMEESRIRFTNHHVAVNYANLNYAGGEYLTIYLQSATIPEPATATLVAVGALAVTLLRRSRRAKFSPHEEPVVRQAVAMRQAFHAGSHYEIEVF